MRDVGFGSKADIRKMSAFGAKQTCRTELMIEWLLPYQFVQAPDRSIDIFSGPCTPAPDRLQFGNMPSKDNRLAISDGRGSVEVTMFVCKLCLDRDGVVSDAVTEHHCTNDQTGKQFTAFVCARCLEAGRVTRLTCRTFVRVPT
jgi:hypothetical protein